MIVAERTKAIPITPGKKTTGIFFRSSFSFINAISPMEMANKRMPIQFPEILKEVNDEIKDTAIPKTRSPKPIPPSI